MGFFHRHKTDTVSGSFTLTAAATDSATGQMGQGTAAFTVGSAAPVISLASSPWLGNGQGMMALNINPIATGDLIVLAVSASGAGKVNSLSSNVSGGGVSSWHRCTGYLSTSYNNLVEIWYGVVTTRGSFAVTITNSSMASEWNRYWAAEYQASGSGVSWQLAATNPVSAVSGQNSSGTGSAITCPALSGHGLYVGAVTDIWGYLTAGTTSGFTYSVTADEHLLTAYNTTQGGAPACTSTNSGEQWNAISALFTASSTQVPLTITTTTLPSGRANFPYTASLTAAGGA